MKTLKSTRINGSDNPSVPILDSHIVTQFFESTDLKSSEAPLTSKSIQAICSFPKDRLEKLFKSALVDLNSLPNMTPAKLLQFLLKQGTFPDKHRLLIYK